MIQNEVFFISGNRSLHSGPELLVSYREHMEIAYFEYSVLPWQLPKLIGDRRCSSSDGVAPHRLVGLFIIVLKMGV